MATVIALIGQVLAGIASLLGIANELRGLLGNTAAEHLPYQIESTVTATSLNVAHPTYGLSAQQTELVAVHSDLTAGVANILAAITGIPNPVNLPVSPPAGYGGATAAQVWDHFMTIRDFNGGDMTASAEQMLQNCQAASVLLASLGAYTLPENPDFAIIMGDSFTKLFQHPWWDFSHRNYAIPDNVDWTQWDGVETVAEFLQRVETQYGEDWTDVAPDLVTHTNTAYVMVDNDIPMFLRCKVTNSTLPLYALRVPVTAEGWPGISGVVLGTPVVVSSPTEIAGPIDGALWHTDSAPSSRSRYAVGTFEYAYHLGSFSFTSDNGQAEAQQWLGWSDMLLMPLNIASPASLLVTPGSNVQGTVTPWTRA